MRALSALELLGVWEQGLFRQPVHRALILLSAAFPDVPFQTLAELSLGQRDAYLLTLREWTFGPQLVSWTICPVCGEKLELTFDVSSIRVAGQAEPVEPLRLEMADYEIQFRLPNSLDLIALPKHNEAVITHRQLFERCLLTINHQGDAGSVDQLPKEVVQAITTKMAEADPQADIELALTCPGCTHQWAASFDIISFFWEEINAWAYRTLSEVHMLASAYGWSEDDILALSPWKRQVYLTMVHGS